MVSTKLGAILAAQAAFLVSSSPLFTREDQAISVGNTLAAVKALQSWYDEKTGLWTTTGWWNSANCLTVLADWALADPAGAASIGIKNIMYNTFTNAQRSTVTVQKQLSMNGMPTSTYTFQQHNDPANVTDRRGNLVARGFSGFINDFYDDEGWWALAWIRAYDVTRNEEYIEMAKAIFEDMKKGVDNVCGGGIWWSKEKRYKNAIANSLYLAVAASLTTRVPESKKQPYRAIAASQLDWFLNSGMINKDGLINDGLVIQPDGRCVNNGLNTWSYNQGAFIGAVVEYYRDSPVNRGNLLDQAEVIAHAAINALSDTRGVIHEIDQCEPNCGDDGSQFKGIFVRNLHYLQGVRPNSMYRRTIALNADSIWKNDRDGENKLGVNWSGPPVADGKGPTAGTHSSALDVLVADIAA